MVLKSSSDFSWFIFILFKPTPPRFLSLIFWSNSYLQCKTKVLAGLTVLLYHKIGRKNAWKKLKLITSGSGSIFCRPLTTRPTRSWFSPGTIPTIEMNTGCRQLPNPLSWTECNVISRKPTERDYYGWDSNLHASFSGAPNIIVPSKFHFFSSQHGTYIHHKNSWASPLRVWNHWTNRISTCFGINRFSKR